MEKFNSIWEASKPLETVITAGTMVVLPCVWGHTKKGMTPVEDIQVEIKKEGTLADALVLVEKAALEYVQGYGAECLRQYYIERVIFRDNKVVFEWGT